VRRLHLSWRQIAGRPMSDRQPSSPAAFLGADHPLVGVVDLRNALRRQSLATAPVVLAGTIGFTIGAQWGLPLLIAAALVQLLLAAAFALLAVLQQALAWDLIVEGRGHLPIPSLARELRRVQRPSQKASLARELEDLVQQAERWPMRRSTLRPIFDPRQIRAEAAELRLIGALLQSGPVGVRGVAHVERLLRLGDSSLYRREPDGLHRELKSICTELTRTDPSSQTRPDQLASR
jgi:hypothetical protein